MTLERPRPPEERWSRSPAGTDRTASKARGSGENHTPDGSGCL